MAHDLIGGIAAWDGVGDVDPYLSTRAIPRMGCCGPDVDRMPTDHRTRPGDAALSARAREAALRVYRADLVDILLALTTAIYSGSRERFRQAAHDAAGRIRRSVAALEVADLEHQLRTGRLLFPDRETL